MEVLSLRKYLTTSFLLDGLGRKLFALVIAIVTWLAIYDSITVTKTITRIPIKVINLEENKTVLDLQPSGYLLQRATITVTAPKSMMNLLDSSTLEIIIDATGHMEEWIAEVSRYNLHSLHSELILPNDAVNLVASQLIIKVTDLVTEKFMVKVNPPIGDAPEGYTFVDIWPESVAYQVTGPKETLAELKQHGVEFTFDLGMISREDLDMLLTDPESSEEIDVSFFIPRLWKKLPTSRGMFKQLDHSLANKLRINFVRQQLLPLEEDIPIHLFFPVPASRSYNPEAYSLFIGKGVESFYGIKRLAVPLYIAGVSRGFLEVVKDFLQITIIVDPRKEQQAHSWSIEVVNAQELEERFIQREMEEDYPQEGGSRSAATRREFYRRRFRHFLSHLSLYREDGQPLELDVEIKKKIIFLRIL
jgi:hypothetical protein